MNTLESNTRTVRIFISSTFRDMHSERDYLVKFVFPELRERCIKKGINLVDVDLRWGVTEEEAEQGKALEICLDEIENCRPFFIGILGERYGWTPSGYQVPDYPRYDWLKKIEKGHSITALEIYQGVLKNPGIRPRAFFYFRSPDFIKDVPFSKQSDVIAENQVAADKLYHLKEDIKDSFKAYNLPGHITESYKCNFRGIRINWTQIKADMGMMLSTSDIGVIEQVAGMDNVVDKTEYEHLDKYQRTFVDKYGVICLDGLEDFGESVLNDLWNAIQEEYPDSEADRNPLEIERGYHERFMVGRTRFFIGRTDILETFENYLTDTACLKPLLIIGEPGSGKSALMAKAALKNRETRTDCFTIIRFIGASPSSSDIFKLIRNIFEEIVSWYKISVDESRLANFEKLSEYFREIIFDSGRKWDLAIFIDALNQLNPTNNPHYLTWLPKILPPNVKIIISMLEGEYTFAAEKFGFPSVCAGKLNLYDCRQIVETRLGEYRKTLSDEQFKLLLSKQEAIKPLYLAVACEELRIFPSFEFITSRIRNLPERIPDLFEQVLERIEQDHGRQLAEETLCLLECSMYGLLESELLELLKRKGEEHLPVNIWAKLYRNLAPYLLNTGEKKEGLLNFFHIQLSQAIRNRYLKSEETKKLYFKKLADYGLEKYNLKNGDITNTILYTGIYLYKISDKETLYSLLLDCFISDIFNSDNTKFYLYRKIADEIFDYVIDKFDYDKEDILKEIAEKLAENYNLYHFSKFLNLKSLTLERNGQIRWASALLGMAIRILESLVESDADKTYFMHELSLSYNIIGNIYKTSGDSEKALKYFEKQEKALDYLVKMKSDRIDFLTELSISIHNIGNIYRDFGEREKELECFEKQKEILESVNQTAPNNVDMLRELSLSYNNIGNYYRISGDTDRAITFFIKQKEILEYIILKNPTRIDILRGLSVCHNDLGNTYKATGVIIKALENYEKQLFYLENAVSTDPRDVYVKRELSLCYHNLGNIYRNTGNRKKALNSFIRQEELLTNLISAIPGNTIFKRDLSTSCNNLGNYYLDNDDREKALEYFQKSVDICELLVIAEPQRNDFKNDLCYCYHSISNYYFKTGDIINAMIILEKEQEIVTLLLNKEPENVDYLHLFSLNMNSLGFLHSKNRDYQKAIKFYNQSINTLENITKISPSRTDLCRSLFVSFYSIGDIYMSMKEILRAISFYERSMKIIGDLFKIEPERIDRNYDLYFILDKIGMVYFYKQDYQKAIDFFERSLKANELLIEKEPSKFDFKDKLISTCEKIGISYLKAGFHQKALEYYEKQRGILEFLIKAEPLRKDLISRLSVCLVNIGWRLRYLGNNKKALELFEENIRVTDYLTGLDPENIDFKINLAISYITISTLYSGKERLIWLGKAQNILQPLMSINYENKKLKDTWEMLNEYKKRQSC